MPRDSNPNNMEWGNATTLPDGDSLTSLRKSGCYIITNPTNGPVDPGTYYVNVTNGVSTSGGRITTHLYTNTTDGSIEQRVHSDTAGGWSALAPVGSGGGGGGSVSVSEHPVIVENTTTTAPPGSPADGDTYVVGATATGDWTGLEGQIATWSTDTSEWTYVVASDGWSSFDKEAGTMLRHDGTTWNAVGDGLTFRRGSLDFYVADTVGNAQPGDYVGWDGLEQAMADMAKYVFDQRYEDAGTIYLRDGTFEATRTLFFDVPGWSLVIKALTPATMPSLNTYETALLTGVKATDEATLDGWFSTTIQDHTDLSTHPTDWEYFADKGTYSGGEVQFNGILFKDSGNGYVAIATKNTKISVNGSAFFNLYGAAHTYMNYQGQQSSLANHNNATISSMSCMHSFTSEPYVIDGGYNHYISGAWLEDCDKAVIAVFADIIRVHIITHRSRGVQLTSSQCAVLHLLSSNSKPTPYGIELRKSNVTDLIYQAYNTNTYTIAAVRVNQDSKVDDAIIILHASDTGNSRLCSVIDGGVIIGKPLWSTETPDFNREVGRISSDGTAILSSHILSDTAKIGVKSSTVKNVTTTAPPGSPVNRDAYIIAATATGDWTGLEGQIAIYNAPEGWLYYVPEEGWTTYDQDANVALTYDGSAWASAAAGGGGGSVGLTISRLMLNGGKTIQTTPYVTSIGTSGTPALNQVILHPILIHRDCTLKEARAMLNADTAGGQVRLGLYDSLSDGTPDTLIYSTPSMITDTAAVLGTAGLSVSLTAGLHWGAYNGNQASIPMKYALSDIAPLNILDETGSGALIKTYGFQFFHTFAVLPSSLVGKTLTGISSEANVPMVMIGVE